MATATAAKKTSPLELDPLLQRRVVVECVTPEVDEGRFAAKRTVGEEVAVEADVFADGHDAVAAALLWRRAGAATTGTRRGWRRSATIAGAPRSPAPNIPTTSTPSKAGSIASRPCATPSKRRNAAGQDAAADREELRRASEEADRRTASRYGRVLRVAVDRERARFGAWYEMFPRSAGDDPSRSATFEEAAARLPYDRVDGLRRALPAADSPDRPQLSQRAQQHADCRTRRTRQPMGDRVDGGRPHRDRTRARHARGLRPLRRPRRRHTASRSRSTSRSRPRRIIPTSTQHPEWFRHRPDGTIKYAENPPKKYQDIYPFDFESADWQALWHELKARDRVLDRTRRHHLPRRQPAHQAVAILGLGDRRDPARASRTRSSSRRRSRGRRSCATSPRSASRSRTPTSPGATPRRRSAGVFHRADADAGARVLAAEPVREHARHPARVPADGRPRRLRTSAWCWPRRSAPATASTAASSCARTRRSAPAARSTSTPRSTRSASATSRAATAWPRLIARINTIRRAHAALQFDRGLRFHETDNPQLLCYSKRAPDGRRSGPRRGQPRPLPHAARPRPAAARRLERADRRRGRRARSALGRNLRVARRVELRPPRSTAPASRTSSPIAFAIANERSVLVQGRGHLRGARPRLLPTATTTASATSPG